MATDSASQKAGKRLRVAYPSLPLKKSDGPLDRVMATPSVVPPTHQATAGKPSEKKLLEYGRFSHLL
ncbi:hypothetical protein OA56_08850 [Tepidiphilus sp. HLB4]